MTIQQYHRKNHGVALSHHHQCPRRTRSFIAIILVFLNVLSGSVIRLPVAASFRLLVPQHRPLLPVGQKLRFKSKYDATESRRTQLKSSIITTTTEEVITEFPSFISDSVFGDIAAQVQSRVKIPPIPSPIIKFIFTQALRSMSQDLSPKLVCQVEELLDSEKTSTRDDDFTNEQVQNLSNAIALELVEKKAIDVPMLDQKQEFEVLVQILNVVFSILTTSESERRASMIKSVQQFLANDLLGTPEGRKVLIQRMNAALDVPLLNEQQEERIITVAVEACAKTLQTLFPPDLLRTLTGEADHNNLVEMKQYVIMKVNEIVDFVGLNEQQEEVLIRSMVDVLIESYVDPTAAELLLLNHKAVTNTSAITMMDSMQQQLTNYQTEAAAIQRKIELSAIRYEREQTNLKSKLASIQHQIQELLQEGNAN